MRRRFGRRRGGRPSGSGRGAPIDAGRWLQKIIEDGVLAAARLEPVSVDGVPADFAAVGSGEAQDGTPLIVGFAPRAGGDAALAALALAAAGAPAAEAEDRTGGEAGGAAGGEGGAEVPAEAAAGPGPAAGPAAGFSGEVIAVAPQWSSQSRRRLGLLGALPFRFRALAASSLGEGDVSVEPEAVDDPPALRPEQVAAHLTRAEDRALFERAAAALEGLASKHGGAVRGVGRAVELVLLARRVAELRADDGGVVLNTILPSRSTVRLAPADLAGALDRLEGNLRKRLNDRRTLEGEDGLRARVVPLVGSALSLRGLVPWPLGGSDQDALDLAAVDPDGRPVVGAVRAQLTLPELAAVLDATAALQGALPHLLAPAGAPLRLDPPRLVLAAQAFDAAATRVLPLLGLGFTLVEIRSGRDGLPSVSVLESGDAAPRRAARGRRDRRPRREERTPEEPADETGEADETSEAAGAAEEGGEGGRGRGRRRRGRGRGRGRGDGRGEDRETEGARESEEEGGEGPRFEEMSAFDLDDGGGEDEGDGRRRRGRRRRGRRGGGERGEAGSEEDRESGESSPDAETPGRGRGSRGRGRGGRRAQAEAAAGAAEESDEEDEDAPEDLEEMVTELPDFDVYEAPQYEDDEEEVEEDDDEAARLAEERERRRRARMAKVAPTKEPEPEEKPPPPRKRSVFVAHADRDSIMATILLARDVRLVEGFWVYPQDELMTFFRSVATDLKENVPIFLVGFQPKPARDVISTIGLYGDRVHWYDHHPWPPEDELAVRQTIGEDNLHRSERAGSSLPIVLSTCSRRSRFSDKLVDLATARFSQHDYERWGRLWWWKLGEMAGQPGDRRRDIDPLLAGRPSDLAKQAARSETPPRPAEVDYVASRDFRLVHFGGFSLVVVDVPEELDPHVCARVARERYNARLSLVTTPGEERVIFSGEELGGKRSLDFGAVVEHLVSKLEWVEPLPEDDHVARFRIRNLAGLPQRLDEVIGEIAMGRSILEG